MADLPDPAFLTRLSMFRWLAWDVSTDGIVLRRNKDSQAIAKETQFLGSSSEVGVEVEIVDQGRLEACKKALKGNF